ncbi:SufE family protein [bacterium]|jgi:cysteine desulfuration protein SufE|nr:SufE family protein [bacterium]MDC0421326.1 SufE family protein [Hellea sp.]MDC1088954.1 SufE family protein [Hellea sp.]
MDYPENVKEMINDFQFLTDWEDRYMHVIDMGKLLPSLNEKEKTDTNKVKGCVSQVWLISNISDGPDPMLNFRGDSDAHIVKGLVAITLEIFSNRKASEILSLNAIEILRELELDEHLSLQRANGLKAMIARIKDYAQNALN